jgi:plastocyanin
MAILSHTAECVASYGAVPAPNQATATSNSGGSSGTGATHTVIVAPTQGVLRYIPFAVNASVGDTVKFMWGANNHTVTKSSSLLPCNRSADALFTSGSHDKDFVCKLVCLVP